MGLAAVLTRPCFAWPVITERFSPLLAQDVFCFWTQMGFSHGHEPSFDCVGEAARAGAELSGMSRNVRLHFWMRPGHIHLWDKKKINEGRGDERWMEENSDFTLYASINTSGRVQLLSGSERFKDVSCGRVARREGHRRTAAEPELLAWWLESLTWIKQGIWYEWYWWVLSLLDPPNIQGFVQRQ